MGTQEENELHLYLWNPSTSNWEAAKVGGAVSGTVAVSNFPATQPVSGNVNVNNFPATQPVSGNVNVNNFPATQPVSGTVTLSGTSAVSMAAPPQTTSNTGGAPTTQRVVSVAGTNATSIKTTQGRMYFCKVSNNSASARYIKFYNKASAPVVGTDVPVMTFICPPNVTTHITWEIYGRLFGTGIAIAITGGFADTDTTATVAGDCIAHLDYA